MGETRTSFWSRLKRWLGMDFYDQAVAEIRREEEAVARVVVTQALLGGGNR